MRVCSVLTVLLHDYETSAVMWCLLSIITMTSWECDLPPAQFAMQGPSRAIQQQQQQCTRGYARGGVWPLKSQNITNPRRTFGHRPSAAPRAHERDVFSPKSRCVHRLCAAAHRDSGCRVSACRRDRGVEGRDGDGGGTGCCTMTDSALRASGYICSDLLAVLPARIRRKVSGFARGQLERCVRFHLRWVGQSACFLGFWAQVCGIFLLL